MKRKIFLTMAIALTATFLASCSCDSCGGNTKVSFKDYYLKNAYNSNEPTNEVLEYKVEHEGNDSNQYYKLSYSDGMYITTLTKGANDEPLTLKSEFSIELTYEYGGLTKKVEDSVISEITFMPGLSGMLRPIRSKKVLQTHSPSQSEPQKLEDCYVAYSQTVETTYNADCTKGTSVITNHNSGKETKTDFEMEDLDKYTYVDNEQLLFALRCMTPSSTAKLMVYSPFDSMQVISTSFGSAKTAKLENLTINGETKEHEIPYYPVTLKIQKEHSGGSQTAWIAKTQDTENNTYRNIMIKYIVPLPLSFGEFHYTLTSATFA